MRPDALAGHRLAGTAANPEAIRMALRGIGANPLLVEAFGVRPKPEAKPEAKPETSSKPDCGIEDQRRTA